MTEAIACPETAELELLVSGSSPRATALEAHLAGCEGCRVGAESVRKNLALESRIRTAFAPGRAAGALPGIAGYRIVREIGRGGMGIVYEAEQLLPPRRVALKVVRGSSYVDDTTLRLFQREIRALARLSHPGIAALYDAGCTPDGEHYFAMELVRGETLRDHARGRPLDELLALFLELCRAVDFAHQRGVIHRDLKPSNVLVDERGAVKVLDFGLARITDQDVTQSTLLSEPGGLRGTLAYMSPEQAGGDPATIDLRSDVYSLGVILYELCTSRLPTDVSGALPEAARRVAEDPPARPASIDARLRGDLETILLKALEKDPARRYASAAAFHEDLRRFLADETILARAPSTLYQISKLVRRHKLPSALLASLFLVSIGAAGWTGLLYEKESELRREAENKQLLADEARVAETLARRKAQDAEAHAQEQAALAVAQAERARREARAYGRVRDFLIDVFAASSVERISPEKATAEELLERGIERIRVDLREDPVVRASLLGALGEVCTGLGLYRRAEPLLEEAVAILRVQTPGEPLLAVALTQLGTLRERAGDPRGSVALMEEAVEINESMQGPESLQAAKARTNLAMALVASGEARRALELYRQARIDLEAAGQRGVDRNYWSVLNNFGLALLGADLVDEAGSVLEDCVRARREEGAGFELASTLNNLGMVRQRQRRLDEAEELQRESLAIKIGLFGPDASALASSYGNLADVLEQRGEHREAIEFLASSREILARARPEGHPALAQLDFNRACTLRRLGELEAAEEWCDRSLAARRASLGPRHPDTAASLALHGVIRAQRGDIAGADEELREAIEILDATLGRRHVTTLNVRFRLAQALQLAGDPVAAARWAREAAEDLPCVPSPPQEFREGIPALLEELGEAPR